MTEPIARSQSNMQDEEWIDPRAELTGIIYGLSDQASQELLEFVREWIKTAAAIPYYLLVLGLCLPV